MASDLLLTNESLLTTASEACPDTAAVVISVSAVTAAPAETLNMPSVREKSRRPATSFLN